MYVLFVSVNVDTTPLPKTFAEGTKMRQLELAKLALQELSSSVFCGLKDSLQVSRTIKSRGSERVSTYLYYTLILNGPLLLGMYILFKYLLEPHFHCMLNFKEHSGFTSVFVQIIEFVLKAAFLFLWVIPIYILSVVLNVQWSQEIGNGAYDFYTKRKRPKIVNTLSHTIAQTIYWQIIFGVFNALNFLCKFAPIIGPPFYFLSLCWLNAVYCFDYKWSNRGMELRERIACCEKRWLYFIGFGLPVTLATFFFEYFISYSLISLLFPLFIPIAMYGSPKKQTWWKPIFPVSRFLASSIMAPLMRFLITVPHLVSGLIPQS